MRTLRVIVLAVTLVFSLPGFILSDLIASGKLVGVIIEGLHALRIAGLYIGYACGMLVGAIDVVGARSSDMGVAANRACLSVGWVGVLAAIALEVIFWNDRWLIPRGYLVVTAALWAGWSTAMGLLNDRRALVFRQSP